jgi:hypothetical protein
VRANGSHTEKGGEAFGDELVLAGVRGYLSQEGEQALQKRHVGCRQRVQQLSQSRFVHLQPCLACAITQLAFFFFFHTPLSNDRINACDPNRAWRCCGKAYLLRPFR